MTISSTIERCPFPGSQTHRSLHTACLGEMHARRLYLHAGRQMEEAHLHVIAHAFTFTAAQEKEHAEVFRGLIRAYGGDPAPLTEDAPLLLPHDPADILRAVIQTEEDESRTLYPFYARTALEEGYPRIAETFRRIGETEQLHARRFAQYLEALTSGTLFRDAERISWVCLHCGQLHLGFEPPEHCQVCTGHRGHFIRSNYYPFSVEG